LAPPSVALAGRMRLQKELLPGQRESAFASRLKRASRKAEPPYASQS